MDASLNIAQKQSEIAIRALLGRTVSSSAGLRLFGAALLGASLLLAGCDSQTSMHSGAPSNEVTRHAGEAAARLAGKEKNEFLQASRQQMDEIKSDLAALKREAHAAQGAAKEKLERRIAELDQKRNAADAKMAALRAEASEAWVQKKQEVVAALADLKASCLEIRREGTRS